MEKTVYLRMKPNLELTSYKHLLLKDIAYILAPNEIQSLLETRPIYRVSEKDKNIVVIDVLLVIEDLRKDFEKYDFQTLGPEQAVIRINKKQKKPNKLIAIFVWFVLFIGTSMTIMNFHYDVSMQEVHQKLHLILTGEESEFPLWIQIPYSIGLGLGTLLFFNHWFNKRFNEEPSPLEVEISNYQSNLDQYLIKHENRLDDKNH